MGLDNILGEWLNECVNVKSFLQALGLGFLPAGRQGFLSQIKGERVSPLVKERERFEAEVREQFKKLKEKGLSIPVFTL